MNRTVIIDLFNNSIGRSIGKEGLSDNKMMEKIIRNQNLFLFGTPDENGVRYGNDLFNEVYKKLIEDF